MLTPEEVRAGFGRRLTLLREALGFRFARSFADHVGLSEALYKYEAGERVSAHRRLRGAP